MKKHLSLWFQPFSRKESFRVFFLLGAFALLLLVLKYEKISILTQTSAFAQPLLFGTSFLRDLLLLLLVAIFFLLVLENDHPWVKRVAYFFLDTFVLFLILLALVEHQFFRTTRTLVSAEIMLYGAQQIWMLSSLLWGQITPWHGLLLGLPLGLMWFPRWLQRRPRLRDRLEKKADGSSLFSPVGLLLLVVFLLASQAWVPHTHNSQLAAIQENYFLRWLREGLQDRKLAALEKARLQQKEPPLFDAQHLRFLPTAQTRRPNIVIVVLESIRQRSTPLADPRLQTMPFLASLAQQGLRVESMYPVVPHTSKAVAAIFCGIYPKITMHVVESEVGGIPARCLPSLLESLGYKTAIFHPATARFENYDQLARNIGFSMIRILEDLPTDGFFRTNYFGYEDRILLKPSFAWLDQIQKDKQPFFLAYHTLTSHHGYTTPPTYPRRPLGAKRGTEYDDYLQSLRYTDDFIKEVFAGFEKRGLIENTVFLFVSDHGEAFGEHGLYQHGNGMWEEIVHIPALIYNRRIFPKARKIRGLRQQIDLLPTVADLLGVSVHGGRLPGYSLLRPVPKDRTIKMTCWFEKHCMALRQGDHKVIYNYHRRPLLAYDLAHDPHEKRDLATQPALQPMLQQAQAQLIAWKTSVNRSFEHPSRAQLHTAILQQVPPLDRSTEAALGEWVRVVGYQMHTHHPTPGEAVEITFVFQAKQTIPPEWQLFFHLEGQQPKRFFNLDHPPVAGRYPLASWRKGEYILDRYRFYLAAEIPPHTPLTLYVGLWSAQTNQRASVKSLHLSPKDQKERRFPMLTITPQPAPWRAGRPPVQLLLDARFGDWLHLVGYNLHSTAPSRNETFDITLIYYVHRTVPQGWQLFFHLEQQHPHIFLNADRAYSPDTPPLSAWKTGQYIPLRLRYTLPPTLHAGATLRLYTGIWKNGQPFPSLTGPQDSVKQDAKGRLLVLTRKIVR